MTINDKVVNNDGLDASKSYMGVIKLCQIIFTNGCLDLIPDTLSNCFVQFEQVFLSFVPGNQFIAVCCSGIDQDVIRVVPVILWGSEMFIEALGIQNIRHEDAQKPHLSYIIR